jgi:hypothetical protein
MVSYHIISETQKYEREILVLYELFFSIFLILYHWLASQEGFSIKRQLVFRTYLNNKNNNFKNATKPKSESKCGDLIREI